MAKARDDTHSADFRAEAIRLARDSGGPLARLARERGIKGSTLRLWVQEARPEDERVPLTEDERSELRR